MAGTGELTPRQQRAVVALLQVRSVTEAAALTKVPSRTLYRWIANDEPFRAALLQAEGAAIDEATRGLVGLTGKALEALDRALDTGQPPTVQLRAAQTVLENLLRLRELRNLEERLTRLEAARIRTVEVLGFSA